MSRTFVLGTVAIAVVVLLTAGLLAVVAQDQPKAPVAPEAAARDVPRPARPVEREARKTDLLALRVRAEQAAMARMLKTMALPPAIAVAGDYVYVVKGNTLYQFAVDGLQLVAKAELEPPAAQQKAAREAPKRRTVGREPAPAEAN